jgi:hypothetical protein
MQVTPKAPITQFKDETFDMTIANAGDPNATTGAVSEWGSQRNGVDAPDGSATILWNPSVTDTDEDERSKRRLSTLKIPTLNQLLASTF